MTNPARVEEVMCLTEKQVGAYTGSGFQRDEWPALTQRQAVLDAAVRYVESETIGGVIHCMHNHVLAKMSVSLHFPATLHRIRATFKRLWAEQKP